MDDDDVQQSLIIFSELRFPDQVFDCQGSSTFLQNELQGTEDMLMQQSGPQTQGTSSNFLHQDGSPPFQGTSSNFLDQDGPPPLRTENMFTQQNENSQNDPPPKSNEYIKNHWIKQEIELFPEEQIRTKRNISCFINELDDFKKEPRRAYVQFFEDIIRTSIFHFVHKDEPSYYISVHVSFTIHVYASVFWVFSKWTKKEKRCYSLLRSRNRLRSKPNYQLHYF